MAGETVRAVLGNLAAGSELAFTRVSSRGISETSPSPFRLAESSPSFSRIRTSLRPRQRLKTHGCGAPLFDRVHFRMRHHCRYTKND
ncbi:hypothetical protein ATK30_8415 [Amycolatopsis echigonensis]|uniref:Uncharacterized protein n=1 Tax=Amycolatopsis echigonensis TaxID=2576905 RepID=A0A2N3WUB1_9PSEU|nr:hypothetical protein ATK30_8415 [Amycolatopsis niigatensis]